MEHSSEYRFDGWTFRERTGELLKAGRRILLQSQPQAVLQELLRRPGELVSRAELKARLWPRGVVDYDTALNSTVRRLRGALGDCAEAPRYIETIPKRGYRFIGRLEENAAFVERLPVVPAVSASNLQVRALAARLILAIAAVAMLASFRVTPGQSDGPDALPSRQAEEDYLLARHFYRQRMPADLALARRYFERVLAVRPDHPGAWAGLASVNWIDTMEGRLALADGMPLVFTTAERALELEPEAVEAHLRLANYYWRAGNHVKGQGHYRRAVALEPEHPLVLSFIASIAASGGKLDEAIELQRRSVEADPLMVSSRWNLVTWLYFAGHLGEARTESLELRELAPADHAVSVRLVDLAILERRYVEALDLASEMTSELDRLFAVALACHGLGRKAESDAALEALLTHASEEQVSRIVEALAFLDDREGAFDWLQASVGDDPWIRYSPFLRTLHADPRWEAWTTPSRRSIRVPVASRGES